MQALIEQAKALRASDIHLAYNLPPLARIDGSLHPLPDREKLTDEKLNEYASFLLNGESLDFKETDLAVTVGDTRIRANLFYSQGHISCALRLLSDKIPAMENLGLPSSVFGLTSLPRGIVLVTGETGSGKSTTLAAMIDHINHNSDSHILTLEDPVEYIYTPDRCLINQREIGKDSNSYADALRAALREDPDILLIGEMRDMDTIETALTAAETGHLVFATLHTNSAADSIDRIVSVFPEARQAQVRMQLSTTLKAVISQQLLPKISSGRALAAEVMIVNSAIKNLIREGKTPQIASTIATSIREGSISMDNSISKLLRDRVISSETAIAASHDPEFIKKQASVF